jgi:hypothetical protein
MHTTKGIFRFFDKLEDRVRAKLSRHPVLYGFIGAVGFVLFWRGGWIVIDSIPILNDGWVSLIAGTVVMLLGGTFVYMFVGESIIISGLKHEKKIVDKTELEVQQEVSDIRAIELHIEKEENMLRELKGKIDEVKTMIVDDPNHSK